MLKFVISKNTCNLTLKNAQWRSHDLVRILMFSRIKGLQYPTSGSPEIRHLLIWSQSHLDIAKHITFCPISHKTSFSSFFLFGFFHIHYSSSAVVTGSRIVRIYSSLAQLWCRIILYPSTPYAVQMNADTWF